MKIGDKNQFRKIGLAGVLLLIGMLPFAYSHFFPGGDAPINVVNNDGNNVDGNGSFNANLMAYGDHNGTCFDTDKGFQPKGQGTMTWFDPTDGNFYTYKDFCLDQNTLVELGCSQQFKINGNQYSNFMIGAKIKCNTLPFSPFSTCSTGFPVGAAKCT